MRSISIARSNYNTSSNYCRTGTVAIGRCTRKVIVPMDTWNTLTFLHRLSLLHIVFTLSMYHPATAMTKQAPATNSFAFHLQHQHQQSRRGSGRIVGVSSRKCRLHHKQQQQQQQQNEPHWMTPTTNNSRSGLFQSSVGVDASSGNTGSSDSGSSSSSSTDDNTFESKYSSGPDSTVVVVPSPPSPQSPLLSSVGTSTVVISPSEKLSTELQALESNACTLDTNGQKQVIVVTTRFALPEDQDMLLRKNVFNTLLLGLTFGYAAYTILNIDHGMTRGWTQGEIALRIPLDNWLNYESSLADRPIATKTAINVIIYLLGDWLSQTVFSGNHILDFNAARTIRNGFIGLCFGPLVHEYYQFSDRILPVDGGMFIRLQKIVMDQTIYLSVKCSIYVAAVGLLNGDDIQSVRQNVQTKIPKIVLTAWKFWPLVHLVTYGVIPARHRILWVNCVDLVWNAILATMSQKKDNTSLDDLDGGDDIVNAGKGMLPPPQIYEATISDDPYSVTVSES
jgi:protein Mpv17